MRKTTWSKEGNQQQLIYGIAFETQTRANLTGAECSYITLYRGAFLCLKTVDLRQSSSNITDASGSTAVWETERIFNLNSFTTDIIENCLFIIWRHLDFYFLHCIPSDEERRMLAGPTLAGSRMRRLQGIRLRVRILVKLSANLE